MITSHQNQQVFLRFGAFFIILVAILFFSNPANSRIINSYESCKKENGNWRLFGDSCADSCISQFNEFTPCVKKVVYGCDCGDDSCLYQNKCFNKFKFQDMYEEIKAQEANKDAIRREKMRELAKTDPSYSQYIRNLFPMEATSDPQTKIFKSEAQLISEKFRTDSLPPPEDKNSKKKGKKKKSGQALSPSINAQAVIKPVLENPNTTPKIPQFYIDREEKESINSAAQQITNGDLDMIFPVIPVK